MKISNKKKKYFQTESIVLNLFNLGEADRIVTLLTPNYGIIRAVAKGVRKPNSRMGGHLDILNKINSYVRIGENLNNLSQADTINSYSEHIYTNIYSRYRWFNLIKFPNFLLVLAPLLLTIIFIMKKIRNQKIIKKWELEEELEESNSDED